MAATPRIRWAAWKHDGVVRFSGVWIKGTRPYTPPAVPAAFDVIEAAVAVPEGGAFDTIVSYDGTAMTAGLFQWTLTSFRLGSLLNSVRSLFPAAFRDTVQELLDERGLRLTIDGIAGQETFQPLTADELRQKFTRPMGKVPRVGPDRADADECAVAFWRLFVNPLIDKIQHDFFREEIGAAAVRQGYLPLKGATIAGILGHDTDHREYHVPTDSTRAMFWSFWQNAPGMAMRYLRAVYDSLGPVEREPEKFRLALARKFAHSTFGFWGIEKSKAAGRESRYSKIARVVNRLSGQTILPTNP